MRLRSIRLQNYRRYKSVELELPDGLVSIIGPNGSGKSTLMEAVAWALFGNQSEIVRTGKESIKRQGAAHTDQCIVRIEFDFEDTGYIVERSMKGKNLTMSASMYAGGNLMARGTEDVSQALMKLFGMDHKSFFISVFARQKELNALTSQPKGERKKMVLRLLDIESVDLAIKKIREDARYAKNAIQSASEDLTNSSGGSVIDDIKGELEDLAGQEKELAAKQKGHLSDLMKIEQIHKKLKKDLESQEKLAREQQKLESLVKTFETKLASLEDRKKELAEDLKQLSESEKKLADLKPKHDKARKNLERLERKQEKAKKEQEASVAKSADIRANIRQLKKEISETEAHMSEIEDMGPDSDCPTCDRKLGAHYHKLLDAFGSQIADRQTRIGKLKNELEAAKVAQDGTSALSDALAKRRARINEKIKEFEVLAARVERGSKLRSRLEDLDGKLTETQEKLDAAEKEMAGLDFESEGYEKAKAAYEEMNAKLRYADREQMDCQTKLARIEEKIAAREKELARLENVKKRFEKKKKDARLLGALEEVMNDFRKHLISRIRPSLASMSSELLSVLTDGRYNEIELDEDYEISIRDQGDMHKLDRFSGGEKDLANLCLRLAISEIIATRYGTNSFDMIVLDEIFGSQDAGRKRTLLATLNGLGNRFKQIFLITHVEDVKELMGNVIQVSEAADGTSMAEVIS